jgi:hypothetical protein
MGARRPEDKDMRNAVPVLFSLMALACLPAVAAEQADNTPDKFVQRQLDKRKVQYEVDKDGDFKVTYNAGDNRTQLAFIRSATFDYGKLKIREIISAGYRSDTDDFPAKVANRMLAHNNEAKLGAWTKQGRLGVFTSKIPADASDQELIDALELTISLADELEKEFSGDKDEF